MTKQSRRQTYLWHQQKSHHLRPFAADPSPSIPHLATRKMDTMLAAANDQVELMQCLGHLPFSKLKHLTLNGEIPKKLAKVAPPK